MTIFGAGGGGGGGRRVGVSFLNQVQPVPNVGKHQQQTEGREACGSHAIPPAASGRRIRKVVPLACLASYLDPTVVQLDSAERHR